MTGRPVATALSLYFTFLGFIIVGAAVIVGNKGAGEHFATRVEVVLAVLISLAVLLWCAATPRDVLPLLANPGGLRWWAVALCAAPVTFAVATGTVEFLVRVAGMPKLHYVQPIRDAGYSWATVVLLVCAQPAVFEELAFRGVILTGLRHVLSDAEAVVVSALMFMIIHLAFLSFPHLVLIGLFLGYIRVRSGSLYPCMAAHFLHNFAVVWAETHGW
jgi:membrane protease YdiL (CAAX protease family)